MHHPSELSHNGRAREPLHRQVRDALAKDIEAGRYLPGRKLPTERDLASELGVSRATIRMAMDQLERERLVDRVRGRGTFVLGSARMGGYLCLLIVGPMGNQHAASHPEAMQLVEQHARAAGWNLCLRYEADADRLVEAMAEVEANPTIVAGMLFGLIKYPLLQQAASSLRVPWVKLGDYASSIQRPPLVDHILVDNFMMAEVATQHLVDLGVHLPAIVEWDETLAWSQNRMLGYRTTLHAAGFPVDHQLMVHMDQVALATAHPMPNLSPMYERRFTEIFDSWARADRWPDGILMPPGLLPSFDEAAGQHPQARRELEDLPVVLFESDAQLRYGVELKSPRRPTWVTYSLGTMVALAVGRLRTPDGRPPDRPIRQYLREFQIIKPEDLDVWRSEQAEDQRQPATSPLSVSL